MSSIRRAINRRPIQLLAVLVGVAFVGGCTAAPTASPRATASSPATVASSAGPSARPTSTPRPSATVTPVQVDADRWIAFQSLEDQFGPSPVSDGDGDDSIFLVRADGTDLHRLIPTEFRGSEIRPTWSPDGKRIAFIRSRLPNDSSEVWVIDADGTDGERVYECVGPVLTDSDCNSVGYVDWGADGTGIYFDRDSNPLPNGPPATFEIWRYDLETGGAGPVITREDRMSVEQSRISPDMGHAAYVRFRNITSPAADAALFVGDLATGEERRITDWTLYPAYPDWSVDGRIAFNTYDLRLFPTTTDAVNLYTINPDGTDLRPLTAFGPNDTRAAQPRWTSDGAGIVYTHVTRTSDEYGERHIWLTNADGSNPRMLAEGIVGTHPELQPKS